MDFYVPESEFKRLKNVFFYELLFVDLSGLNICLICINTKENAFYWVLLIHTLASQYNAKNKRDLGKHSLH